MKRRNFITNSVLGSTALITGSCNGIYEPKTTISSEKSNFRIRDLAIRPPLGWNSFNSYGVYLHHEAAVKNLEAMAEKLKPFGYEYFVIDGGWYGEFELVSGTLFPKEKHAEKVKMNEYGIYQPSNVYFPEGFKPIVDLAHNLGLKIGLHLMRGISRKAVERNLPIMNSPYSAADIADTSSICAWNHHNYGVDMNKPGAQEYYDSVFQQVADWEFDLVKVDDLNPYPQEIVAVAEAIEKTGREMIYSLSPGGAVYMPDLPYYKSANMLRITTDIWDRRADLDRAFIAWKKFQGIAQKGFWPDLDMIPFGMLQLMSPEEYASEDSNVDLAGLGNTRKSNLTPAQMRTFITIRAMAASPLFMGGDLPSLDDYSLELITNKNMLACNQNGECAINVYSENGIEVWLVQKQKLPGEGWIGIFNRNSESKQINLSRENMGLMKFAAKYQLSPKTSEFNFFDIWNKRESDFSSDMLSSAIQPDDVLFLKYKEK